MQVGGGSGHWCGGVLRLENAIEDVIVGSFLLQIRFCEMEITLFCFMGNSSDPIFLIKSRKTVLGVGDISNNHQNYENQSFSDLNPSTSEKRIPRETE